MCKRVLLLTFVVLVLSVASSVANADMVAGYNFNGTFDDASGNGFTGVPTEQDVGFSTNVPPGQAGQSLSLQLGGYVEIPLGSANPILDDGDGFTVMCWTLVDTGGEWPWPMVSSNGDVQESDWFMGAEFEADEVSYFTDVWYVGAFGTEVFDPAPWHHVALVYEGGEQWTYYVDGEVASTGSMSIGDDDRSEFLVRIGGGNNGDVPGMGGIYVGLLDDVGIFDTALTEEEIRQVMDAGIEPAFASAPNPADGTVGMVPTPPTATYISDDVPKDVPQAWANTPRGVDSTLTVADSLSITDLNVELDIRMPGNNADLNVYLTAPDGKEVELFTDIGFNENDFKNTILDDKAPMSIKDGSEPFTGMYRPEASLSGFDDRDTAGEWVLRVEDDWDHPSTSQATATLNAWRIVVQSPVPLSWKPGDGAVVQDVYFSDNFDDVNDRAGAGFIASVAGDVGTTGAGALEWDTTYYWCVDAIDADDNVQPGKIWSFSTESTSVTANVSIANGDDDVEQNRDHDGQMYFTSTDLEILVDPDYPDVVQMVGLRFADVQIPQGYTIASAAVQFDADDVDDPEHVGNACVIIDGELSPDAGAFESTDYNLSARPRTAAQVQWTSEPWPVDGGDHQKAMTTDISSVIQEIVDQDGWAAGNALVLVLSQDPANPSVGHRECESFEGAGDNADQRPMLLVSAVMSETAKEPSPANGAIDVPQEVIVTWQPGLSTVARDVFFGTEYPPAQAGPTTTGLSYDPGKLAVSTTYYLKVDEYEADGTRHEGPVWSFKTVLGEASEPDPIDGATDVAPDVLLSWKAGATAVSYDVYVSNKLDDITAAARRAFAGNQTETTLALELPDSPGGTTYYWRVDAVEANRSVVHQGEIWSFTMEQ